MGNISRVFQKQKRKKLLFTGCRKVLGKMPAIVAYSYKWFLGTV